MFHVKQPIVNVPVKYNVKVLQSCFGLSLDHETQELLQMNYKSKRLSLQLLSCSMCENLDKINRNFAKCLFILYMQGCRVSMGKACKAS